jgi:broad specificity phosphatase PhoE
MTQLIFIRHGETVWNLEGREMGQFDSPLSDLGEKQAKAIAKRLKNIPFTALYSSDLGRAIQTSTYISDACGGKKIIKNKLLRERHMGVFQGCTKIERKEKHPKVWSDYKEIGFEYVIPEGESQRQRYDRTIKVVNNLADIHPDETIVVVSHGGILRGFFEYVLKLSSGNECLFKRRNATFNSFIRENNQWSLNVWGDTSHLDTIK